MQHQDAQPEFRARRPLSRSRPYQGIFPAGQIPKTSIRCVLPGVRRRSNSNSNLTVRSIAYG